MKLNQIFYILIAFGLLFVLISCTKDELTKPAPVSLLMEFGEEEVPLQEEESNSYIKIERARYRFSGLEFEGYRQVGDDYFFTREFQDGMEVWVEADREARLIEFDMPQGEYDQVKISLKVRKSTGGNSTSGGKKGGAYQENASLIMEGFYTNTHQEQVPLIFVYDYDESFEYTTRQGTGATGVSVDKKQQNKAVIRFNAVYWMQLINGRMLQGAKLTEVNGVPVIIISADQNEHIFNLLTTRIKNASELTFN